VVIAAKDSLIGHYETREPMTDLRDDALLLDLRKVPALIIPIEFGVGSCSVCFQIGDHGMAA